MDERNKQEKTRYKLAASMKECMKSAPVDKITVKEIVEGCGVTRQTFYRNFLDKYDLINWYFYMERFGVSLDREEIMSVNGSQEGMAHFAWALCDPGDIVLVPDPGYPIFSAGPLLCGAKTVPYPLYRENGYLP